MKIMRNKREVDLLHGSLWKNIPRLALPMAASSILQQLFNSADTAVAGQFAESTALAAVGANTEIVAIFVSLATGFALGINVLAAWAIGSGNRKQIRETVQTMPVLSLVIGLILMTAGLIIARPVLVMISTPAEAFDQALIYLRILCPGLPFLVLYDFGAAILRARGDSRRPLRALIESGILNVILNLFFVIVCHLDVAGVAIATDIANIYSAWLIIHWLRREDGDFRLQLRSLKLNRQVTRRILQIGTPAALQGVVFCISNVFIQAAINSFGSDAVAGSSVSLNFEYFGYYMLSEFAQASTTFISQNYAAGNNARCRSIFRVALVQALLLSAAICIPLTIFRAQAVWIYTSDPDVQAYACQRMLLVLLLTPMPGCYEVPAAVMRGYGHSLTPALEALFGTCAVRIIWLFTVFRASPTLPTLYLVYPVTWIITTILTCTSLFVILRRQNSAAESQAS